MPVYRESGKSIIYDVVKYKRVVGSHLKHKVLVHLLMLLVVNVLLNH